MARVADGVNTANSINSLYGIFQDVRYSTIKKEKIKEFDDRNSYVQHKTGYKRTAGALCGTSNVHCGYMLRETNNFNSLIV